MAFHAKNSKWDVTKVDLAVIADVNAEDPIEQRDATERFVQLLTEHQPRLQAYVYSLLGSQSRAADVVQETNLVLWRKMTQYDPGKPFTAWAFGIARFQVLAHLRDRKREPALLDTELVNLVGEQVEKEAALLEENRRSLRVCLQQLTTTNRELVRQRYDHQRPIIEIAEELDRSVGAVKTALTRIRQSLMRCVQEQMEGTQ